MKSCSVGIVVVSYGDLSSVRALLAFQRSWPVEVHVVVVDNTEAARRDEESLRALEASYACSVIRAENPGYMGAARLAVADVPQLNEVDFLILSNADVLFEFDRFHEALRSRMLDVTSASVGVVAPSLRGRDGRFARQPHLSSMPEAESMRRAATLFKLRLIGPMRKRLGDFKRYCRELLPRSMHGDLSNGASIFAPHGSLMVFTKRYLEIPGPFDHPCFLFGEEIYVGLRLAEHGLTCEYDAELPFSHVGHGSMGSWPTRNIMLAMAEAHMWASEAVGGR